MSNRRFHGIYAATVCPLRADGSIDEAALSAHIECVAAAPGLTGFLINGHAGENFLLAQDEQNRVLQIARAAAPQHLIVNGINHEDSRAAAAASAQAMDVGADALLLFPPMSWALGHDSEMALRHHRTVVEAVGASLFLYQAPVGAGRLAYSADTLRALCALPEVVGIKEGSWETAAYDANRRLVRECRPDIAVMASGDEHLLTCFLMGSEGSLVSLAAIWPELVIDLAKAVNLGDLAGARSIHNRIYPLAKAIYGTSPGYLANARLKACLQLLGKIPDARCRAPIAGLSSAELQRLRALLMRDGWLEREAVPV